MKFLLFSLLTAFTSVATAAPTLTTNRYISPESEIKITFDKAVVGKGAIGSTQENTLLNIKPLWKGKIYWQDQHIAIFRPTEPSKLNAEYSFRIQKGAQYLDKSAIPKTKLGKRPTHRFDIVRSHQVRRINKSDSPAYYIAFNQDVNAKDLSNHFIYGSKTFEKVFVPVKVRQATFGDINSTYYVLKSWNTRYQETIAKYNKAAATGPAATDKEKKKIPKDTILKNAIIVEPASTLPVGEEWKLFALKTLPDSNQSVTLGKAAGYLPLGTKEPFEVNSVEAITALNEPRYINVEFSHEVKEKLTPEKLKDLLSITPKIKNVRYNIQSYGVQLFGDFESGVTYTVTVKPELKSLSGAPLSKHEPKAIEFKHLNSSIAIPSFSIAQHSNGTKNYPIQTANMENLRIRIKALTPEQAVRAKHGYDAFLESQNEDEEEGEDLLNRNPLPYTLLTGKTIYDKEHTLANAIDTSSTLVLDWDKILPKDRDNLIFFLDIEGSPKEKSQNHYQGTHRVQSFIQLTNIGIAWKISNKETLLYCYSCSTGKPIKGVQFQQFTPDAELTKSFTSDQHGMVKIAKDSKLSYLVASNGSDSFVLPFDNTLDTVALWRFPVNYDWHQIHQWQRRALIFTDRELYKPGETVHLKGIVREYKDNKKRIVVKKNAKLIITDGNSRTLVEEDIQLSENGTFDHSLKLHGSNVGWHSIYLTFSDPIPEEETWEQTWFREKNAEFSAHFEVQEFRKNAFKVKSKLSPNPYDRTKVEAQIDSSYYMGTAVAKAKVNWYLNVEDRGFYPQKFRDYYFGNHLKYDPHYWNYYYGYKEDDYYSSGDEHNQNGTALLDDNGGLKLDLKINPPKFPTPQSVSLFTEVTDSRQQTISNRTKTTVHPASHYLGIGRIDSLIRVNQANKINLVAVDKEGELSKIPFVSNVTIERIKYTSVKVRSKDGKVSVKNTEENVPVSKHQVTIPAGKTSSIDFTPAFTGEYIITVESKDKAGNRMASATRYHVYGADEYPWAMETGMKIKIAPEQQTYNPGDTARILVMSPIEGSALITVERSGIQRYYLRELKASDPVIELPIEHDDAPNIYVSVLLIRGSNDSPHQFKEPALRLGYCNINVKNTRDKLDVALDTLTDSYRPGSQVTLSGTIRDAQNQPVKNAEVVLYAEDNGVLDVIGYRMPKPLPFFNHKLPLMINCGTSLDGFLAEMATKDMEMINFSVMNKGYTIGGGGDELEKIINLRKNFNPCAVWAPKLTTDSEGRFTISFTAPDALTSYKVMAIALAGTSQFGSASSEFVVNKPLMLQPMAPRFANEGDHTTTLVKVTNNSKFSGKWKVSLKTNSHTTFPKQKNPHLCTKLVSLEAGQSQTIGFDVYHRDTGLAKWQWHAQPVALENHEIQPGLREHLSDAMQSEFSVLFPRPILRQAKLQRLKAGKHNLLSPLDKKLLNGRGHIDIEVSNNLLFRVNGAADHLLNYPYG